jgi:two-component system, chemotaxis family, sensor kinase CheA
MDAKEHEFLERLKATFRLEAEEHVRAISAGLIELEREPTPERQAEIIETVFREAHSLKGAARSVNLKGIESVCQPLEGAFSALKRGAIVWSPPLCDLFHQAVDTIAQLVSSKDPEGTLADRARARELIRLLGGASAGGAPPISPEGTKPAAKTSSTEVVPTPIQALEEEIRPRPAAEEKTIVAGTVRIATARLDRLFLQAEEMVSVKMAANQRIVELQEINRALASYRTESAKWKDHVSTAGTPQWNEWQWWNETRLDALESQVAVVARALEKDQRAVRRLVDEHLEAMKSVLVLPVASLVEAFPMVVRDLARDQGKEAGLVIHGAEIEIDKRILEDLKDPLIHLIRNCIDHGISKPEERAARNKARRGTITIAFSTKDSRQVELLVSDDGAGIEVSQVRAAAIKRGLLSRDAAERLDAHEALSLVFQSGISTSQFITDISGRGLGLAIVREKVEKLGGTVSVDTQTQVGTTFRFLLPQTLATFRGVLVRVNEQVFVLPTINVERALMVNQERIQTVENRETLQVDGQILSLVGLGDALAMPLRKRKTSATDDANGLYIVVLAFAEKRIAFKVDEVLDEQQVMVKGLGSQLRRVRNIAGATVLGSGKVVPVLNVSDLMKSAVRSAAPAQVEAEEAPSRKGRILVAEDSITARTLLKNILETAGYLVATAVDGVDAFTQARSGDFDLVVSDVDMPRMSGFELTAKVRGDKKLAEVPVVLVTALETREDRERGIDAGANAYIVKSSFDQSNLLEVIQRLL